MGRLPQRRSIDGDGAFGPLRLEQAECIVWVPAQRRKREEMRFLTMDRRGFLGGAMAAVAAYPLRGVAAQVLGAAGAVRALPTADQLAWQDLEIGMFVHFAPNTW